VSESVAGARARYLRATVAYDGTDFCGFQVQAQERTVQGELETALATITQEPVRITGAGRTDSGVHAVGQVVAFHTTWQRTVAQLHRAWNAVLPRDVAVLSLTEAAPSFHPRFGAQSRAYRYTIWNHPVRNPLLRRTALWQRRTLDLGKMAEAARLLGGEHDFATFGSPPQGTNTIRRIYRAMWARDVEKLYLDIEGNAFLYRMVRSIVGTLLQVGTSELSVERFASIFAAADRSLAGPTAPAHGLCLMVVKYQGVPE
jgi:tRNA pseudouridine38-40 synthase